LNASYTMKSKVFQLADDKIVKVKTTNGQTVVIIRNKYNAEKFVELTPSR